MPCLFPPSNLLIFFLCLDALLSRSRFTLGGLLKQNDAATFCKYTKEFDHAHFMPPMPYRMYEIAAFLLYQPDK
jgi:hypothetical protein